MKTIIEGHKVEIDHSGMMTTLSVDDHDLSQKIVGYRVEHESGSSPRLFIEYACHEQLTIDGEMEVIHICPKGGRKKEK